MSTEKLEKHDYQHINEDRYATQKDLRILSLELEQKILASKTELEKTILEMRIDLESRIAFVESSLFKKLGALIVACSGILFALLSFFHK